MTYDQYIVNVNKTWKRSTHSEELAHCRLALIEEIGEIAGWYKKHIGYGLPKDANWKTGIKGEFGDLFYYLTKYAELTENENAVKSYLECSLKPPFEEVKRSDLFIISYISKKILTLIKKEERHNVQNLLELLVSLHTLISREGWTIEEILLSNVAKLKVRHGNKFSDNAAVEEGRDREKEDKAIEDADALDLDWLKNT